MTVDEYEIFLKGSNPINRLLNVGPPLLRMEQLHTLLAAGIITVAAPTFKVTITTEWAIQATDEQGHTWTATQLVEARLPATTVKHTADPLLSELAAEGIVSSVVLKSGPNDSNLFLRLMLCIQTVKHSKSLMRMDDNNSTSMFGDFQRKVALVYDLCPTS